MDAYNQRWIDELNSIIIDAASKMADEAMQEFPSRDKLREHAAVIRNAQERKKEYFRVQEAIICARLEAEISARELRRRLCTHSHAKPGDKICAICLSRLA